MNWALLTGTFVANGTEKYMTLGNFKSDLSTNSVMINPANLPLIATDILYDDVSVIDIDLPAYAGPDIWAIPTNTVYLGRQQDVGIDEACVWYHLPNLTTAIDTAAGITVTVGTVTNTYVVRQEICGNVKWDTVVVYASGVGVSELKINNEKLKIYPQPANEQLIVEIENRISEEQFQLKIINNLGELTREEQVSFKNKTLTIKTDELPNGVYLLQLSARGTPDKGTDSSLRRKDNAGTVGKRFVIHR